MIKTINFGLLHLPISLFTKTFTNQGGISFRCNAYFLAQRLFTTVKLFVFFLIAAFHSLNYLMVGQSLY